MRNALTFSPFPAKAGDYSDTAFTMLLCDTRLFSACVLKDCTLSKAFSPSTAIPCDFYSRVSVCLSYVCLCICQSVYPYKVLVSGDKCLYKMSLMDCVLILWTTLGSTD